MSRAKIKLHNRTKCPDSVIMPILRYAGRRAGVDINNVLVQVNSGRTGYVSGYAYQCDWVRMPQFKPRGHKGVHLVNGGYYKIVLPNAAQLMRRDLLAIAEDFYWVAFHEWVHVGEFQQMKRGKFFEWDTKERRGVHDKRPEEIRAFNAEYDAKKRPLPQREQGAILSLALWLEEGRRMS